MRQKMTKGLSFLIPLLILVGTSAQADVLISIKPSARAVQGIQDNLLKAFDKLNPKQPVPPWLAKFDFTTQPFHVSLGYIQNAEWKKNHNKISQIIDNATTQFQAKNGAIQFTFKEVKVLGSYVVIEPNQATADQITALNKEIHDELVKNGLADGLGGSKGFGLPGNFIPHLSVAKTEDLKNHAEADWRARGLNHNFLNVLDKYMQTIDDINKAAWCNMGANKPQGYSFKFESIDVSDSGNTKSITQLK